MTLTTHALHRHATLAAHTISTARPQRTRWLHLLGSCCLLLMFGHAQSVFAQPTPSGLNGPCDTKIGRPGGPQSCGTGLSCTGPFEGIYGHGNCQANKQAASKPVNLPAPAAKGFKPTCPAGIEGCSTENTCNKCDSSCGQYCQNTGEGGCGPSDCKSCPPGKEVSSHYDDGTGTCEPSSGGNATGNSTDNGKYVFVTSQSFDGNIGGVSGANYICQELAKAAGHEGQYKAWISDNNSNPAKNFSHSNAAYFRTDGVLVATSWNELLQGNLEAAIDHDEYGQPQSNNSGPWTGTEYNGTSTGNSCQGWANSAQNITGDHGCTSTNTASWSACGENWCNDQRPLYCVQQ